MDRNEADIHLRKTVASLKDFLETELEYVEEIIFDLENGSKGDNSNIDDNIDYLIRDLVPEYQNQQDAVDTLVEKLKEIQDSRENKKGLEWEIMEREN